MSHGKAVIGLSVVLAVIAATAIPAAAEFSAIGGKTTGESGLLEIAGTAGGATFGCETTLPNNLWIVESEKEHTTKGAILALKIKSWGECGMASKSLKTTKATFGECEMQIAEPKEEATALYGVVSTCTLQVENEKKETCEDKIEATNNKDLKSVSLAYGGEANLDTVLDYNVTGVNTKVNKACELAGIGSTKTATLLGYGENLQVVPGRPAPTFRAIRVGAIALPFMSEKRKVTVGNHGLVTERPLELQGFSFQANSWLLFNISTCKTMLYIPGEGCEVEVEKRVNVILGAPTALKFSVESPNTGLSEVVFIG